MKNLTLTVFTIILCSCSIFAQFITVTYDFERNWFNEGQPLPAEKSMVFKGMAPEGTEAVEFSIQSAKRGNKLYQAIGHTSNNNELFLIIPYKLQASSDYDFVIKFFNALSDAERSALQDKLTVVLETYIEVNLGGGKSIKFLKKNKKIIKDMNNILKETLGDYRTKDTAWEPAFSELVGLKLTQLEKANLAKTYVKGDTTTTKKTVRSNTRQAMISDLKAQIKREVSQMLDTDMFVLENTRFVDNYITENKENSIALNVGYGGVYLSGSWNDFTYGSSPYLGMAFPLGNSVLGSKFLSNTSVTLGVFVDNFKDENGNKVTGFVVNRPIYLGLDHKLFKFIRVNAGATFLEGINVSNNPDIEPTKKVMIRPYLGLSARIDLSIGLGK